MTLRARGRIGKCYAMLRYSTPWPVSLLMVLALGAASGLILEKRVRGVEVIA